jgi:hypothetical protein
VTEPAYDTLEGIKSYLTDLNGLERLRSDRHKAWYERKERLHEFIIMGQWHADSCGNFGKCSFELNYTKTPKDWTFPQDGLPVIRRESLWSVLGDETWSISTGMRAELPPSHILCPECGKGWTLGNAHDAVQRRESIIVDLIPGQTIAERELFWKDKTDGLYTFGHNPGVRNAKFIDLGPDNGCDYKGLQAPPPRPPVNEKGWRCHHPPFKNEKLTREYVAEEGDSCSMDVCRYEHTQCNLLRKYREERQFFTDVFIAAGIFKVVLSEIPNRYWPDAYGPQAPWFLARMPYGNIVIGWRKRVISIDWSDTKMDLYQLFASEDVTKEKYLVHAWGKDKAVEYLKKIHAALV